jgi:2-methylcitrate dehydratase
MLGPINTVLIRYLDFMDSYLAGEELCHPSDNTAAVLAASEHVGASGKDFLTSLARRHSPAQPRSLRTGST